MNGYFASMNITALREFTSRCPAIKPDVLLSYALLDADLEAFLGTERGRAGSMVIDSGLFTFNNGNPSGDMDELFEQYLTFARYGRHDWDLFFNFDRYFDLHSYERNLEYQVAMEQAGIPAVPVIHNIYNDDIDKTLRRGLPEHRTVAIGQCKGRTSLANLRPAVMKLHAAGARVHLFGSMDFRLLTHLPIASCDASSWCKYPAMGVVLYWNPKAPGPNKTVKLHFPKWQHDSTPSGAEYYGTYGYRGDFQKYLFTNLGLTEADLLGTDDQLYQSVANMFYYCQLVRTITEMQAERGFSY